MRTLEVTERVEPGELGLLTVTIRGVDAEVWRQFKARAALRDERLGDPATRAFRYLLQAEVAW